MIFKQNVHLTIGLSELPLVNVGDRQFRELCLSAPRAGYKGHKICGRILEVCNVGGDWLTLAVSITSPGTQIIACIEKRDGVVNAVHAYDPYDLTPGVEGQVSYVYFENADEVITVHGFAYGQRYPGEVGVADIWGTPPPGEPPVAHEFAFLNHRTVKFRDEETDNVWVGEFTGKLLLPEWSLEGTLEGAVPAEVCASPQEVRSVDNVVRILKQDVDHIAINNAVTCSEVQAMATGSIQMTGSLGIDSVPNSVPQRSDVQGIAQRADVQALTTAQSNTGREVQNLVSAVSQGLANLLRAISSDADFSYVLADVSDDDPQAWASVHAYKATDPSTGVSQIHTYKGRASHDDEENCPKVYFDGSWSGHSDKWELADRYLTFLFGAHSNVSGQGESIWTVVRVSFREILTQLDENDGSWRQVIPLSWDAQEGQGPTGTLVIDWIDENPDITIDQALVYIGAQVQP